MEYVRSIMIAIVLSLTVASAVFAVVATATTDWKHDKFFETKFGLFQICTTVSDVTKCISYQPVPSYLNAVRAFMIMGDILLAFALPLTILHALGKLKAGNKIIASVLVAAGLFFVIACSIYTGKTSQETLYYMFDYGYSFGLAWAAGPIGLVAALFAFFATSSHYLPIS